MTTMHTFAIYVEDQPGVLNRVASLFRRRGVNIHSLAVGPSETNGVSRMTAVVRADAGGAIRIRAHLQKLIPVLRVEDITHRPSLARELALIKVTADHESRSPLVQLAQVFAARVEDVAPDSVVLEMTASPARIDALLEVLRPHGVLEVARTGQIAMTRGTGVSAASDRGVVEREAETGISYSV